MKCLPSTIRKMRKNTAVSCTDLHKTISLGKRMELGEPSTTCSCHSVNESLVNRIDSKDSSHWDESKCNTTGMFSLALVPMLSPSVSQIARGINCYNEHMELFFRTARASRSNTANCVFCEQAYTTERAKSYYYSTYSTGTIFNCNSFMILSW